MQKNHNYHVPPAADFVWALPEGAELGEFHLCEHKHPSLDIMLDEDSPCTELYSFAVILTINGVTAEEIKDLPVESKNLGEIQSLARGISITLYLVGIESGEGLNLSALEQNYLSSLHSITDALLSGSGIDPSMVDGDPRSATRRNYEDAPRKEE